MPGKISTRERKKVALNISDFLKFTEILSHTLYIHRLVVYVYKILAEGFYQGCGAGAGAAMIKMARSFKKKTVRK